MDPSRSYRLNRVLSPPAPSGWRRPERCVFCHRPGTVRDPLVSFAPSEHADPKAHRWCIADHEYAKVEARRDAV